MIRITLLSGPHAGQSRTSEEVQRAGITNPLELISDLARKGYRWEIDFSNATEEALDWARADLVGRVLAAALMGRSVRFMGQRWIFAGLDLASLEAQAMVSEIEDAIVYSGRNVVVLVDDWVGDLVIGVRGYEAGSETEA